MLEDSIQPEEIERKYLIKSLPEDLDNYPHDELVQGYVAITDDGTEVRLRKNGDKFLQTIKSGSGKIRAETEIEITEGQYNALWATMSGKRLEKTRYKIPHDAGLIELDVYKGDLAGLVTAEIEFKSEDNSNSFIAPEWFGEEKTEDKRFKNQSLALNGVPSTEAE